MSFAVYVFVAFAFLINFLAQDTIIQIKSGNIIFIEVNKT